jgi:V8-like Glu-specific endopeptidase
VGRVELNDEHVATAFLVTPTLAITNRHVAQSIATFAGGKITLLDNCTLDFGREDGTGRKSFDQRKVLDIVFAGPAEIAAPIDHERLDLAVLRVSPSALAGAAGQRHMVIGGVTASNLVDDSRFVAAVGYPADPELFVPEKVWTEYGKVIRKLLEGDGGAKRFAPGQPMASPRENLTDWTATHDATTINGNSGSPLLAFPVAGGASRAIGLHYGGRSGGDRVNWAHLLHYVGARTGFGAQGTFADFCTREGIDLS